MEIEEDVVIVGGGIAGLATALALKRVGIRALVLEKSQELRATGAALTLFPNAWTALDALGVAHKLASIYSSAQKGYVTNVATGAVQEVSFTGLEGSKLGSRSVHRKSLLETLAAELPTDTIRFSSKLSSIQTHKQKGSSMTTLLLEDGAIINAKVLIGCDGVHSVVAQWLGLTTPIHSGRFAVRGLAVYPQGHGLTHGMQQFLYEKRRAGFTTLSDKELYWFLIYNSINNKDEEMKTGNLELIQKNVLESVAGFPPVFLDVVRHADLSTLSCAPLMLRFPWDLIFGRVCKENVTVAGDAMHPMTPDLGQGGCAALEDAVVLGRHIGNSFLTCGGIVSGEVSRAIEMYVKERRWRAAGLITGSYLSGWVHGSSGWFMKFLRDTFFYRSLFSRLLNVVHYDCGKLPSISSTIDADN